ncbi:MAG TPA: helix-turn-helix transcriptional regulator [Alphaproteobacteria bacterium]|nr:helix-turn-helix transcriptional regulator [Alphaproteobacteria bacterium]
MDRRDFLAQFRERLERVIGDSGLSRSAFAEAVGMDRSTLSQLLSPSNDRLPRVETLAAIATTRQVSVDWLLGLSQKGQLGTDILREQASIERNAGTSADARLIRWQTEAVGYKIRYVPSTLPDLLKTEEVIRYELEHFATKQPEQEIETAAARLAYQRRPETDMESCNSVQAVEAFARGQGLWHRLDPAVRARQLDAMSDLLEELYPTFRWFLYDGLQRYSVPVTIFGPLRAAIYIGQMYLVFQSTEHIRALTENFDGLIRGAVVQPTEVPGFLRRLRGELPV